MRLKDNKGWKILTRKILTKRKLVSIISDKIEWRRNIWDKEDPYIMIIRNNSPEYSRLCAPNNMVSRYLNNRIKKLNL